MAGERILVVDDEQINREFLHEALTNQGFDVTTAADGPSAIQLLKGEFFHIVLSDLKMPRMSGVDLLHQLKEIAPSTVGIIFTGYATIETAVEAMKAGAFHYVTKPFRLEEIRVVLQRALEFQRLHYEVIGLRRQIKAKYKFENIISDHDKMQEVFELVEKVSDSDSTILIFGEIKFKEVNMANLQVKPDDQIHPNELGHRLIAQKLFEYYTEEAAPGRFKN